MIEKSTIFEELNRKESFSGKSRLLVRGCMKRTLGNKLEFWTSLLLLELLVKFLWVSGFS